MAIITYMQVQQMVARLPAMKLPLAYRLLEDLATADTNVQSPQAQFMQLPLSERRRIMAQQAEQSVAHYQQTVNEWQDWQAGDFVDGD